MQLQKIELNGFQVFDEVTFMLPSGTGFYLLMGVNNHKPGRGSNGTGKSSLLSAIYWALYGSAPDGRKAKSLLNRNSKKKGYSVTLTFDTGVIHRSWGPNSLLIDGSEVEQKELNAWIKMTPEQFLYAMYISQGAKHFIDLGPTDKLNFLSQLFQLDKWLLCSEKCKLAISELAKKLVVHQSDERSNDELIATSIEMMEKLQLQIEEWETQHAGEILELKSELAKVESTLAPDIDAEEIRQIEAGLAKAVADAKTTVVAAMNVEQRTAAKLNSVETELKLLNKRLAALMESEDKNCPQCKQVITPGHVETIAIGLLGEQEILQEALEKEQVNHGTSIANRELQQQLLEKYNKEQQSGLQALSDAKAQIALQDSIKRQVSTLKQKLETSLKQSCPLETSKLHFTNKLDAAKVKTESIKTAIKALDAEIEQYSFWQKHFPLVRLSILQEVAQELELHFCQALTKVGMPDYSIRIETERELKNASVKKELNIQIFQDDVEIDYIGNSGGEKQRLKLATAIGISDLIKARCAINWDLFLGDEMSTGLSSEGLSDMIDMFKEISNSQLVIIAEHQKIENCGEFDGIITLIKGSNGNTTIEASGTDSRKIERAAALRS